MSSHATGRGCRDCGAALITPRVILCDACRERVVAERREQARVRQAAYDAAHRDQKSASDRRRRLADPNAPRERINAWRARNPERAYALHDGERRWQAETQAAATRIGDTWTPEDDANIIETLDRPTHEVALELGRTRAAVAFRRNALRKRGLAPPPHRASGNEP